MTTPAKPASDTPRTKDAFDALRRKACGTLYVEAKMEELERENAELWEALDGMLSDWEDHFGQGACDCRKEPENIGHVCNACISRAILARTAQGKEQG